MFADTILQFVENLCRAGVQQRVLVKSKVMKARRIVIFIGLILIIANLLVLTKYILFKHQRDVIFERGRRVERKIARSPRQSGENWELFATIRGIYNSRQSDDYKWRNIGGNFVGFVPLGFLLPLVFFRRWSFILTVMTVFEISMAFEVTQLYTNSGVFDVDDLLLNTMGGAVGCGILLLVRRGEEFQRVERKSCVS